MKIDRGLSSNLGMIPTEVRAAEELGFAGVWSAEARHDAFLPLAIAAEHSRRLELGTGIAVAFSRSPLHLAHLAYDLQAFSEGRFMLGLGSQVKAHVERRFSAAWSQPVARMRELILAVRAIWASWNGEARLDFRGDFYQHTLMVPFFDPGPNPFGNPEIFLAAVGPKMTAVAGEVADGLLVHGLTSERYLREVIHPSLAIGSDRRGSAQPFEVSYRLFVVTGSNEAEYAKAEQSVKAQIAFYASTPAYRHVLELHGWENLHTELRNLSQQGQWDVMSRLIEPAVLDAFAVCAPPERVPALIEERYGDVIDRCTPYCPSWTRSSGSWEGIVRAMAASRAVTR